eukprot:369276-Amphidinium_carterae.1
MSLYFLGSTEEETIRLHNISDAFFLEEGRMVQYNSSQLVLPATAIPGYNIPWLVIAWILPTGAILLLTFIVVQAVRMRLWCFDVGSYLQFTYELHRRFEYRVCAYIMSFAPLVLPVMWVMQIIVFDLEDQWSVLQGNTLSGILLLWSLSVLAVPEGGGHDWRASADFMHFKFRRPICHLLMGTNARFALKLSDALWTSKHGDSRRLERLVTEASQ